MWPSRFYMAIVGAVALRMSFGCTGCTDPNLGPKASDILASETIFIPDTPRYNTVDMLLVLGSSQGMVEKREKIIRQLELLGRGIYYLGRCGLSLHLGVVSSDLGTGPHTNVPSCSRPLGDQGIMGLVGGRDLAYQCIGPGQRYMVDAVPKGCDAGVTDYWCEDHTCGQENCDAVQQGNERLELTIGGNGYPRCRNFKGEVEEVLTCLADLEAPGCAF